LIADAAKLFYDQLAVVDASAAELFRGGDLVQVGRVFVQMMAVAVRGLNDLDNLLLLMDTLGASHAKYGLTQQHYDSVGCAFLYAVEAGLSSEWDADLDWSFRWFYSTIALAMMASAMKGNRYGSPSPSVSHSKSLTQSEDTAL